MKQIIIIRDGIIRQGKLEFKVDRLTLDLKGRIVSVEGNEVCTSCKDYLTQNTIGKYCSSCGYRSGGE